MSQQLGFAYAMVAMFLMGFYMVPRQHTAVSERRFLVWMGVGILISSSLIGFAAEGIPRVTRSHYLLTFAAGLVWSVGALGYAASVQRLGIARATPIKNTYGALSTVYGIAIFHEFTAARPTALALAVLGSVAIVVSASLLGRVEASRHAACPAADARCVVTGMLFGAVAALGFGTRSIPTKIVLGDGVSAETFLFYMAQGAFVGNLIAALAFRESRSTAPAAPKDYLLPMLSGAGWAVAAEFLNLAVIGVGIAVAFPLMNLSTLVAVGYALLVAKGIDLSTHRTLFWSGLVVSLLGAGLLAAALELR